MPTVNRLQSAPCCRRCGAVSRYAQLQPNFMGVGIKLNAILDDIVALAEKKVRKEQDEIPSYSPPAAPEESSPAGPSYKIQDKPQKRR